MHQFFFNRKQFQILKIFNYFFLNKICDKTVIFIRYIFPKSIKKISYFLTTNQGEIQWTVDNLHHNSFRFLLKQSNRVQKVKRNQILSNHK